MCWGGGDDVIHTTGESLLDLWLKIDEVVTFSSKETGVFPIFPILNPEISN